MDEGSRGWRRLTPGARFLRLLARRPHLFAFVVAIVVARVALSVLGDTESPDTPLSLVITVVLVIEVLVVWRSIRGRHSTEVPQRRVADGTLDWGLIVVERFGAWAVGVITAGAVALVLAMRADGASRLALLGVISAVRYVELALLLAVLVAARQWEMATPEPPPVADSDIDPGR